MLEIPLVKLPDTEMTGFTKPTISLRNMEQNPLKKTNRFYYLLQENIESQPPFVNGTKIRREEGNIDLPLGVFNGLLNEDETFNVPAMNAVLSQLTIFKVDEDRLPKKEVIEEPLPVIEEPTPMIEQ